jgi:Rieske Fe-S protein
MTETKDQKVPANGRRDFLKRLLAAAISAVLGLVPVGAGLTVLLDPLRRKAGADTAVPVAALDALPEDGVPRKFTVLATRTDAWNRFTQVPVGAVYLRRLPGAKLQAFNVVCPHAGCFVDFDEKRGGFLCPCHNSTFTIEGKIADRSSPSPRALDSLEVEVREGKVIWVKFRNFQAGRAEKVPVA